MPPFMMYEGKQIRYYMINEDLAGISEKVRFDMGKSTYLQRLAQTVSLLKMV